MTDSVYLAAKREAAVRLLAVYNQGFEIADGPRQISEAEMTEMLTALNSIKALAARWTAEANKAEEQANSFLSALKAAGHEYFLGEAWSHANEEMKAINPEADSRFVYGPVERLIAATISSVTARFEDSRLNCICYAHNEGVAAVGYDIDGDPVWNEARFAIERQIPDSELGVAFNILVRTLNVAFREAFIAACKEVSDRDGDTVQVHVGRWPGELGFSGKAFPLGD